MEQIYYDTIMAFKREGKYDECLKIYNQYSSENEDATFYSGRAKIYLLMGDYDAAIRALFRVFYKCFMFRLNSLEDILTNKNFSPSLIIIQQEIEGALKTYEVLSTHLGGDLSQMSYQDFKLNKLELALCFCSGHDETYYRYLFALTCSNRVPFGCEEIATKMLENKTAILNCLKGVSTQEEKQKDMDTWQFFLRGGSRNKYAIIYSLLYDFANFLNLIKLTKK